MDTNTNLLNIAEMFNKVRQDFYSLGNLYQKKKAALNNIKGICKSDMSDHEKLNTINKILEENE